MKKLLTLIITAIFFTTAIPLAGAFPDVEETHENYLAITFWENEGILSGYQDGTFGPNNSINRAEVLKIILTANNIDLNSQDAAPVTFSDVPETAWFAPYVATAQNLNIVNGNPDGSFAPDRQVAKAEFLKMLLSTLNFNPEKWKGLQLANDIYPGDWYDPYMNYATQAGLITKDANGNANPSDLLTRAQVAEIMYIMRVILSGKDTPFLMQEAENQMAQIDIYVGAGNPLIAKRAAELSVDMTQQAYKNLPEDKVVLAAAKLARAYDFVMNAYLEGLNKNNEEALNWSNQAITKATEAWEVNNEVQPIAKHIKNRANEVIAQLGLN